MTALFVRRAVSNQKEVILNILTGVPVLTYKQLFIMSHFFWSRSLHYMCWNCHSNTLNINVLTLLCYNTMCYNTMHVLH